MPQKARSRSSGFTLTELLVVVVIVGVLSAIALPTMTRDRREDGARGFAQSFQQDLRRARFQAVGNRLPIHVYIFRNRVEFRESQAPTGGGAPIAPTLATPPLRILWMPEGVVVQNVTASAAAIPALDAINTAVPVEMQCNGMGQCRRLSGGGLPTPLDEPTFIWIEHTLLPAGHPARRLRLDVSPLTGMVQYRTRWDIT